jgi:hypothetical protein
VSISVTGDEESLVRKHEVEIEISSEDILSGNFAEVSRCSSEEAA